MADIIFGMTVLLIAALIISMTFRDMISQWRQEDAEDEFFDSKRAERQAEFDKHAQAVARAYLIEQCESIYIGDWRGRHGEKD